MLFTAIICFCIQLASVSCCDLYQKYDVNTGEYLARRCDQLATKPSELAMCLLQRNTLDTVLGCTDWKKNWHEGKYVYWPVTKYSVSDGMDLMPVSSGGVYDDAEIDNFDVEDDGMLKVTPRGLLIAAAEMTHCTHCRMDRIFHTCPYNRWQDFLDCLCCRDVDQSDIDCLEDCIWDKQESGDFGERGSTSALLDCPFDLELACKLPTASTANHMQLEVENAGQLSESSCTGSSVYVISNGKVSMVCAEDATSSRSRTFTMPDTVIPTSRSSRTYSRITSTTNIEPTNASRAPGRELAGTADTQSGGLAAQTAESSTSTKTSTSSGNGAHGSFKVLKTVLLQIGLMWGFSISMFVIDS